MSKQGLYLILLCLSINAFAWDIPKPNSLAFSLGTWLENYGQVRATTSDETNGFEFNPYITASSEFNFYANTLLLPEVGYVIQRTENEVRKNHFFIRTDIGYDFNKYIRARVGTSFMIHMISGDGGEDTLENGDTTETYYVPNERRTAYNQTLDFGLEVITKQISYRAQAYIYSFNEEDDRMYTISLSANYIVSYEDLF